MNRTGGPRARAALPPWLTAVLALTAVALLHAVQCASGAAAPLLATSTLHQVAVSIDGHGAATSAMPVGAATAVSVSASTGSGVQVDTGQGAGHSEMPCGPGLAAGTCLMLLVSAAVGLLARGRPGWSSPVVDEFRTLAGFTRWRASPDLAQLCVLRT
ncbi:hypothetical protein O7627_33635 [Solwaraspora sp. WMMD1047]|uniref:hypothetical protein n=1 Tax=Solwaraspora sp. WMMD1047 TaxID=3016102 RepID=UPI0024171A25|nr:hypothetical protein [Solwaraspora sp. WMMD1047]MDG4834209.1 hypothetical protein [Solwaraspora sp. WMMD1047]